MAGWLASGVCNDQVGMFAQCLREEKQRTFTLVTVINRVNVHVVRSPPMF